MKQGGEAIHHYVEGHIEKITRTENKKRRPMAAFANELYSVPSENVVPPNTSSRLNGDVHGAIIIEVSIVGDA